MVTAMPGCLIFCNIATGSDLVQMSWTHLGEELSKNAARVVVSTKYGQVKGGRAVNGAVIFLGASDQSLCPVHHQIVSNHGTCAFNDYYQRFHMLYRLV